MPSPSFLRKESKQLFFRGAAKFLSSRGYAGFAELPPFAEICDNAPMKSQTVPNPAASRMKKMSRTGASLTVSPFA